jgi:hypothetical protein
LFGAGGRYYAAKGVSSKDSARDQNLAALSEEAQLEETARANLIARTAVGPSTTLQP